MKNKAIRSTAAVFMLLLFMLMMTGCSSKNKTVTLPPEGDYLSGQYNVVIDVSGYGKIYATLDADAAPITVTNFIKLVQSDFYNGLTFHRIMSGFMIQGGDPLGTGAGGSEEKIFGEFASNGFENSISHKRGVLSMARRGNDNNSASSQFFIVHSDSTFLDGDYAAFGWVTEGMDIVDSICKTVKPTDSNGTVPSKNQPKIKSITIVE